MNHNLNYKNRKWNDFSISKGSKLKEVFVVNPSVYYEYRGEISTIYHSDYYDELIPISEREKGVRFKHDRYSKSFKNVLRGLHWDDKTWKLVSCFSGFIYLVVLDVREGSENYGVWESFIISEKTGCQILIPPGFANGHLVLEESSIFHYKMAYSGEYNDENAQKTIKWNDPKFKIDWPISNPILSPRDRIFNSF